MMIVHSGESRDMRQQMQDEIEVLKAQLYNANLEIERLKNGEVTDDEATPV